MLVACGGAVATPTPITIPTPTPTPIPTPTPVISPDEQEIRQAFDDVKKALVGRDGSAVVPFLSSTDIEFFEPVRKFSIEESKDFTEVQAYISENNLATFLQVISSRVKIGKEKIATLNTEEYIAELASLGAIVGIDQAVADTTIDEVTVSGNTAMLQVSLGPLVSPEPLIYLKEGGKWKFQLNKLYGLLSLLYQLQLANVSLQVGGIYDLAILGLAQEVIGAETTEAHILGQ